MSAEEARCRPNLVPYLTAWSSERTQRPPVIVRGAGIGYADESPYGRDGDGVLWMRESVSPGRGRPEFGRVHLLRQRRAMRRLLCQVCGRSADRDGNGVLWLLGEHDAAELTTTHPPLCVPCAAQSVRSCPYLRNGCTALRARTCTPIGVHGMVYRPGFPFPLAETDGGVLYGDQRIPWTRAAQLIVRLSEVTVVELDTAVPAARR
ncbi:hypothetical protein GT204_19490 [Streptomyces sp. SID4919]|uniref:hypothetical protein n=1 Tax=unclassified Streptomyces TaxID=2593676 RepID=UPI000823EBA0|nr:MULTISPECIES: hypothetical protein [unclassified Streptomyces]MYY11031.1 hypothetical protein [Streptomyces sp. SID4919]SCK14645.1 hypothetical protein YW7DRAFT_00910 [Streptomyces sp. AmelKG-E11A]